MKEQLIQYVNLLFAGTTGCDDIRQEILQNTLDRYEIGRASCRERV